MGSMTVFDDGILVVGFLGRQRGTFRGTLLLQSGAQKFAVLLHAGRRYMFHVIACKWVSLADNMF
jgi:hypothetical protein